MRPSACSSSVLLPMPGSPASRVTEPGTRPPSSTRSSSPTPVGTGTAAPASTSPMGTGPSTAARDRRRPDAGVARATSTSSTSVPHASHCRAAPEPPGRLAPHSEQRWTVRVLMAGPYDRGTTLNPPATPFERVTLGHRRRWRTVTRSVGSESRRSFPRRVADAASHHDADAGPATAAPAPRARPARPRRRPGRRVRVEHRGRRVDRGRLAADALHRGRPPGSSTFTVTPNESRRSASERLVDRVHVDVLVGERGDHVGIGGQPGLQVLRGRACRSSSSWWRTCPVARRP